MMAAFENLNASHRAILLDVDGTLYAQGPLRLYMMARLTCAAILSPRTGVRSLVFLKAYRQAQEHLRELEDSPSANQLELSCRWSGEDAAFARECVMRWMESEPLPVLRRLVRPGVHSFLEKARSRRIKLGVVSDYPAHDKLEAMGLLQYFDVVVSAQEAGVGCFKPSPKGLEAALRLLNIPPEAAIYVGDRANVDAEAARRANVSAVIVGRPGRKPDAGCRYVANFAMLERLLFGASN